MDFALRAPFNLTSYATPASRRSLGDAGGRLLPLSAQEVVRDARSSRAASSKPGDAARGQVVVTVEGEGWTVFDIASQATLSSRSFPPGVQFAGSAAALSTLAEPSAEGGSSRVRYVYVPISSHPTHTNKLVREGQTVSVSTELEIKGGFGERGASSANEADLGAGVLDEVYREFEDRVVAVKPIPATLGGRVAVLLRSGVLLVCDPTLRRTLTRSQPPASLPALAGDRVVRLDAFEHSDTPSWRTALQYKDGGVILAQHIAPRRASPSRSFANAAAPGLKKRKAAFSDTSSAQESAHAYTGFVIAYPTGQSEGGQQPTAVEIPGPVVDMTVTSRAEVLVLRPKGAVEVIDILSDNSASVEALQRTRAALAPLSVGIQLHPANSALLAIPAPSPSSLALLVIPAPASKTPASTTPTLVTLLLDLRFGRVLAAAETILPTSLFSGSNMAIPFAVRPALAASSQNLILSVVGPARQMIQVQELIVPDRGSSAASALRGSQSDALASRWLSVSRSPALRSHAKALGTDVAEEIASIRAESGEAEPAGQWTASKIQRVDSLWGEWIAGQAMIQTEEKTRPRRRPTHSFTPDVARTLARSCLDLPGVPPRFGPGPSVALRYPSQIVAQLIRDDVLSDAYVERGVLATLVALQDWDNVVLGVSRIPDLSEDTLASALQAALSSPSAPADKVLLSILNRSSAVVTWRSIVSALLVGEVVRALEIVQSWLRDILSLDGIRESPKSTRSRPAHLALDNNVNQHEPLAKALDLPAIVAFAQLLLDTHMVSLLHHHPAQPALRAVSLLVAEWLRQGSDLLRLDAPLAAFSHAQRTSARARRVRVRLEDRLRSDGVDVAAELKKGAQIVDGKLVRRKKAASRGADPAVGEYTLERFDI